MRFNLENKTGNIALVLRRAGYHYLNSRDDEMNFVRPLGQDAYPRFHLFVIENKPKKQFTCTLHLDQKKPSYKGATAHSGEYDSPILTQESDRIKQIL